MSTSSASLVSSFVPFVALVLAGTSLPGCSAKDAADPATDDALGTSRAEWKIRNTWSAPGSVNPDGGVDWKCASDKASARILCTAGGTDMWTTASSITSAPTYALKGTTYTQVATAAASPPGRRSFSLATVPAKNQVMLFGGFRRPGVYCNDTWTWNGTAWREEAPAHKPPPRQGATIVEDPTTKHVLLFGGRDEASTFRDLWEWDGTDWMEKPLQGAYPGSPTAANIGLRAVAIPTRGAILVVDPYTGLGWIYRGGVFTQVPATTPLRGDPAYSSGTMGYDDVRDTVQLFMPGSGAAYEGRLDAAGALTWTQPTLSGRLDSPHLASAVYDSATRSMVVFTGTRAWDLSWFVVPNKPPVVRPSVTSLQGFAGEPLTFTVAVDDLDDRPSALNVKATNLPPGATWDGVARTFTWTPTPAQKGTYTVRLVANDGVASSAPVSVKLEVLWHAYAMLPTGDIDMLTGGDIGDSFTGWNDPDRRILRGLFTLPAVYERKTRDGYFTADAFPWPFTAPILSCRFSGTNPGKVVATCIENNQGAQGPFSKWQRPVAEDGSFTRGRLVTVPNEGPAVVASGYQVYLNSNSRIRQTGSVTALLRPFPAR